MSLVAFFYSAHRDFAAAIVSGSTVSYL